MPLERSQSQQYWLLAKPEYFTDKNADSSDDDSTIIGVPRKPSHDWRRHAKSFAIQVAILTIYTGLLFATTWRFVPRVSSSSLTEDMIYTPMRDAFRYQVREVDYNFESVNAFKGRSLETIDAEWDILLNNPHEVLISKASLNTMNRTSIEIQDGHHNYLVQPIAYHMLHCLYHLYKYVHPDFYGPDPDGPDWVVTHTDHCVDNLRQFVQCHAGSGMSSYKWLDGRKIPWPVLSTQEVCVDWTHYDGWVREHSLPMDQITTLKGEDGQYLMVHPKFGGLSPQDYIDADVGKHQREHSHDGLRSKM